MMPEYLTEEGLKHHQEKFLREKIDLLDKGYKNRKECIGSDLKDNLVEGIVPAVATGIFGLIEYVSINNLVNEIKNVSDVALSQLSVGSTIEIVISGAVAVIFITPAILNAIRLAIHGINTISELCDDIKNTIDARHELKEAENELQRRYR